MTRRRLFAPMIAAAAVVLALAAAGAQGASSAAPAGAQGAAAAASATGPSGATGVTATQALSATLTACHADPLAANRYAIFASQTVAASVRATLVMSVEFVLQERSGAGVPFVAVKAAGFDVWIASQPHVGIFTYNHEVTGLPAPAAFRVLVKARWIGRHRRVLHEAAALSPACIQPLLVGDLIIGRITRSPGPTSGTFQYAVEVRNLGTAAAGPFDVSLSLGATALAPVTVPGLAAGASQAVVFTGPACTAGNSLTAIADPTAQVVEPANPRRTRTLACPVP